MKNKKLICALILISILFVVDFQSIGQCAMCRSAVESTMSNGRNMSAVGLNMGILYLLMAPYILVATIGYLWYRTSKKNKEARILIERRLQNM